LEVDAIAQAYRAALGSDESISFWEELRARHLGPIRASGPAPPAPAMTDFLAARDRVLAIADAWRDVSRPEPVTNLGDG
jgi:hypothetical protein